MPAERNPLSDEGARARGESRLGWRQELHTAHTYAWTSRRKVAGLLGFSLEHGKDC